jgi:hypothetical protein
VREGEGAGVIISGTSGVWGSGLQSCKVDEMLRAPSKVGGKGDTLKVQVEEITFFGEKSCAGNDGRENRIYPISGYTLN